MTLMVSFFTLQFIILSCATSNQSWERAKSENTLLSYQKFLQEYPKSDHAIEAKRHIELLKMDKAKKSDDIIELELFIKMHPGNEYIPLARARLEKLYFEKAKSANAVDAYKMFIKEHSNSPYKNRALEQIEVLRYRETQKIDTIDAYAKYLKDYPDSQYASKAKFELDRKIFNNAKTKGTIRALENYLLDYPTSTYIEEAKGYLFKRYNTKVKIAAKSQLLNENLVEDYAQAIASAVRESIMNDWEHKMSIKLILSQKNPLKIAFSKSNNGSIKISGANNDFFVRGKVTIHADVKLKLFDQDKQANALRKKHSNAWVKMQSPAGIIDKGAYRCSGIFLVQGQMVILESLGVIFEDIAAPCRFSENTRCKIAGRIYMMKNKIWSQQ